MTWAMLCGMTATRDNNRSGRVPAGAAVLQADVTEAIRQAFFTELAESNANFPRNGSRRN
jgi:hypothetical protein